MAKKEKNNSTATGPTSPPWIELPRDVTVNIMRRLGQAEILVNTQRVCTTWWSVCREPSLWRSIHLKSMVYTFGVSYDPIITCRLAVNRSQGELNDITIEEFGTDDLLGYISDRSSHLKCLRLDFCNFISGEGLTTAVKNFPELEELHLICMPRISAMDIEAISIYCPKLKTFTFNHRWSRRLIPRTEDSYAITIAKNMPNLSHLRLFGNNLTDEGLEAILDGCPRLEYLDLRQCYGVYLHGDLEERCLKRIKVVRMPSDVTDADDKDEFPYLDPYESEDDYEGGLSCRDVCDYYSDDGYISF